MSDSETPEPEEESEWRFDVADVGDVEELTIEPESIDPVNAAFFLFGIGATIAVIVLFIT